MGLSYLVEVLLLMVVVFAVVTGRDPSLARLLQFVPQADELACEMFASECQVRIRMRIFSVIRHNFSKIPKLKAGNFAHRQLS